MRTAIAIGLLIASVRVVGGQETPKPPEVVVSTPAFEVASVRANAKGPTSYSFRWFPGGRFQAVNVSLHMLIGLAYDLRSEKQLMGAPRWTASERFDVEAVPAVESLGRRTG